MSERRGFSPEPSGNGANKAIIVRTSIPGRTVVGVFEPQCKICRLSRTHPDVVDMLHEMRFGQGASYRDIISQINAVIGDRGIDVRPLNLANLVPHFSSHVPADRALAHDLNSRAMPQSRTPQNEKTMSIVLAAKRENYRRLQENLDRWQVVFEKMFERTGIGLVDDDGDDLPIILTKDDISSMKEATASGTAIMQTMDKFIKNHAFVLEVLEYAVSTFATRLSQKIGFQLSRLQEELSLKDASDPATIEWYDREVRLMLVQAMDGLYEEIRGDAMQQYNL